MSVFTCDDFEGHYPVGSAAIIIAANELVAKQMLLDHLSEIGLPQRAPEKITVRLLDIRPGVTILVDGNY